MTFGDPGPRLSERDISRFEQRLQQRLPDTYRSFLLEFNGGLPSPDTIDVPGAPGMPTDVHVLFGIGRKEPTERLEWNADTLSEGIADGLLPIGSDSGGELFHIVIEGASRGSIVYGGLFHGEGRLFYLAAPDFFSCLARLKPFP